MYYYTNNILNHHQPKRDIWLGILSLIIAIYLSLGLYGYGVDYYSLYYKPNNIDSRIDFLGLLLVSLDYSGFKIGVFFLALYYTLILGVWYNKFFGIKARYLPVLTSIFSWPHLFNILNVMRQGLLVAVLHHMLYLLEKNKNVGALFLGLFLPLAHRSGVLYLSTLVITYLLRKLRAGYLITISIVLISASIFYILLSIDYNIGTNQKIIGLNLNYIYMGISLFLFLFISIDIINYGVTQISPIKLFVFTLIILLIPVHILGMRWQFERFHMVILLPEIYLLFEYLRIKKNEAMNIAIIALFILTFMLGMHQYFGHSMNDFI